MQPVNVSNARVLIVDDQLLYRDTLSSILAGEGLNLNAVTNGQEALKAIQAWQPDLVLLDIEMPGMNGFEVCEAIKTTPDTAGTQVVFFSWQDDAETVVKGISFGANDFLSKGTPRKEMLARILTHLRGARLCRTTAERWHQRTIELEQKIRDWRNTLLPLTTTHPDVKEITEQMASAVAA